MSMGRIGAMMVLAAASLASGQTSAPAAAAPASGLAAAQPANTSELTNLVQPAIAKLQFAMSIAIPEKWKVSKAAKEATVANVGSIRKDVESTLPPLLTAADAAPNSLNAELPLARNLGALYDVLLRVAVVGESGAPQDQQAALAAARTSLDDVRRTLDTRIQSEAEAQDTQITGLKKQVATQTAAAAAAANAAPCKPAPTKSKKKKSSTS